MWYKTGLSISVSLIIMSCGNNSGSQKTEANTSVDSLNVVTDKCTLLKNDALHFDTILLNATTLNDAVAQKAMTSFYDFSNNCKDDSLAPIFLIKAGQVAQSIRRYTEAKSFFTKCISDFPKFNNRSAALFLLAQLYDNATMLNDESEARTIYHQLLREYPKSPFANDAKACIKNIGKTDEQLVEEFLKKN